jgi:hypothetical protein
MLRQDSGIGGKIKKVLMGRGLKGLGINWTDDTPVSFASRAKGPCWNYTNSGTNAKNEDSLTSRVLELKIIGSFRSYYVNTSGDCVFWQRTNQRVKYWSCD